MIADVAVRTAQKAVKMKQKLVSTRTTAVTSMIQAFPTVPSSLEEKKTVSEYEPSDPVADFAFLTAGSIDFDGLLAYYSDPQHRTTRPCALPMPLLELVLHYVQFYPSEQFQMCSPLCVFPNFCEACEAAVKPL